MYKVDNETNTSSKGYFDNINTDEILEGQNESEKRRQEYANPSNLHHIAKAASVKYVIG